MHYNPNQLKRFRLGTVVADTTSEPVTNVGGPDVGHIVGFSTNTTNELILKVEFAKSGTRLIHPGNLSFFE